MSFAKKLVESGLREVEAGGAWWRIQSITTADLVMTGMPMLAKLPSVASGEAEEAEAKVQAMAEDPGAVLEFAKLRDTIVCAGVVAGRDTPDGAWDPVRLVLEREDEDIEATPPRVCVETLPQTTRTEILAACMDHANDNGRLAKALERFRGRSDGASGA